MAPNQVAETSIQGLNCSSYQLNVGVTPGESLGLCPKCKDRPAEFTLRKSYRTCFPCLEAFLSVKVKGVLKGKGGVTHQEHIAVAFSGGSSSSLMLEVMTKFHDPQAGQYDKQKMAFDLSVFHIDEDLLVDSAAGFAPQQIEATAKRIINGHSGMTFKSVPLADIYGQEESETSIRKAKLAELLAAIKDSTGKADLLSYLKTTLLLQLCKESGCKKLVVGYNADAFATRAIASAVKGAGYALPSDAQHVDARHASNGGATLIYPMKDVTHEEIDAVCKVLGLPCKDSTANTTDDGLVAAATTTTEIDRHNINDLAALFVENVLKHNPGAVHNINSTISRLEDFSWNVPDVSSGQSNRGAAATAAAAEEEKLKNKADDQVEEVLCPLCSSPLADDEVCSALAAQRGPLCGVCDSCRHQIFGAVAAGDVLERLPRCVAENIEKTAEKWNKVAEEFAGEEPSANELRKLLSS